MKKDREPTPLELPGRINLAIEGCATRARWGKDAISIGDFFERVQFLTVYQVFEYHTHNPFLRSAVLPDTDRAELFSLLSSDLRPGVYMEIGHGVRPYPLERKRMTRQFTEESPYYGIEPDAVLPLRGITLEGILEENPAPEHVHFFRGDGQHLDLPDGSVQEIYMRDVILSPGMRTAETVQLLREAKRVLHPETGVLIIDEPDSTINRDNGFEGQDFWRKYAGLGMMLDVTGFQRRTLSDDPEAFSNVPFYPWNPIVVAQPKDITPPPQISRPRRGSFLFGHRREN